MKCVYFLGLYLGTKVSEAVVISDVIQTHDEGDWGIQEVNKGGREDGHIDMLPGKWKHQCAQTLSNQHQLLQICKY